jgi:hypothetical protein
MEPSLGYVALSNLPKPLESSQPEATACRLLQAAAYQVLRSPWLTPADSQQESNRLKQATQLLRRWPLSSGLAGFLILNNMVKGARS